MAAPNTQTSVNPAVLAGGVFGAIVGSPGSDAGALAPIGFYGAAGDVQQTAAAVTTGFTAATGTAVLAGSTFTGNIGTAAYTIGDVVAILKKLNLIAS